MDNHAGRPEVAEALAGRVGISTRFSNTLQQKMMYVAVPVVRQQTITVIVRVFISVTTMAQTLRLSQVGILIALLVFNNVTRLRRLETMRRDFVANVSHELKTPITAIKGMVETLLTGALQEPQTAERFLGIVARQSDRLEAIIDDLLTLSRIEQDSEQNAVSLNECQILPLLPSAQQVCRQAA
ncbi:MAG: histidine kinase dimerization/phospho-acceptor domain-containing protein, partial [Desulfuromonadaceae bacterium]